jgi:hypothetical protein
MKTGPIRIQKKTNWAEGCLGASNSSRCGSSSDRSAKGRRRNRISKYHSEMAALSRSTVTKENHRVMIRQLNFR